MKTRLKRQDIPYWAERYGGMRVPDDLCPSCNQVEDRFHFLSCQAHTTIRAEITTDVLRELNNNRATVSNFVPAYWDPDGQASSLPEDSILSEAVMKHTVIDAARGIIP